jgi:hypothetical protein
VNLLIGAIVLAPTIAVASLSDVFQSPLFTGLNLAPLAPALADTVASTYPVASASSSFEFVYNPAVDVVERRPGVLGPILGERAETLGPGQFDLSVDYSFVELSTINDESLHHLVNVPSLDGRLLFFPVPGGVTLRDGRLSGILPVRTTLDIDVRAHIVSPSLTYGLTPDLDVTLTLPILRTELDVRAHVQVPDSRLPAFALPRGDPHAGTEVRGESDSSEGVGDVLLRTKYVLRRGAPADLAVGLGLSLPSGRAEDFQGTGTTRVQPLLIASRRIGRRVELLANAGADLNADDVDRSILRWAAGGTATIVGPVAAAVVFLGRHELGVQTERIAFPFFFQIERNDIYDASLGLRWRFTETGTVSAAALLPLNRDGLRADAIPSVQVEYAF